MPFHSRSLRDTVWCLCVFGRVPWVGQTSPPFPYKYMHVCAYTHTHTHTHTQPAWQALAVANTEPQKESKQKSRHGIRCLSGRCLPAEWRVDGGGRGWRQDSSWDACLQLFREKIIKVGIKVMFEFSKVGLGHWKKKGREGGKEGRKEGRRKGGREEGEREERNGQIQHVWGKYQYKEQRAFHVTQAKDVWVGDQIGKVNQGSITENVQCQVIALRPYAISWGFSEWGPQTTAPASASAALPRN